MSMRFRILRYEAPSRATWGADVDEPGRKGTTMDVVVELCCGLDVHKDTVVACVRTPGKGGTRQQETRTFGTMTVHLLAPEGLAGGDGGGPSRHGVDGGLYLPATGS
jgi:hypothetical protein